MQNSNTLKILTFVFTFLLLFTSLDSYSQVYVGVSIGSSFINKDLTDLNGDDFKIDENSFGYKIFGGFGTKFIGLEGGYRSLGEIKSETTITLKSKITGWDVAARPKIALGPIIIFGKAGAFFGKAENTINQRTETKTSTSFLWGLGAGLKLGFIGIRLEYEGLESGSDSSLSMLTLGGTIHLGGKK